LNTCRTCGVVLTAKEISKSKLRLDQLLLEKGIADSRAKAQALILTGDVLIDEQPVTKAGQQFSIDSNIRLRNQGSKFVGRGGDKIEPALRHFQISVTNIVAIDVGASTGGFTDCLLHHGAQSVYAVDVGYNQLDLKLRKDSRVIVMEKTHAKDLVIEMFDPRPTLAVVDLSFISLRKVLDKIANVVSDSGSMLCLVKPQFELEPEAIEKGGVVRDIKEQHRAINLVKEKAEELGLNFLGAVPCELKGGKKGNQEYFVMLGKGPSLESN